MNTLVTKIYGIDGHRQKKSFEKTKSNTVIFDDVQISYHILASDVEETIVW